MGKVKKNKVIKLEDLQREGMYRDYLARLGRGGKGAIAERGHTSKQGLGTHLQTRIGDTPPNKDWGHTSKQGKGTHLLRRNVPNL